MKITRKITMVAAALAVGGSVFHDELDAVAELTCGCCHTETELCVVFEQ